MQDEGPGTTNDPNTNPPTLEQQQGTPNDSSSKDAGGECSWGLRFSECCLFWKVKAENSLLEGEMPLWAKRANERFCWHLLFWEVGPAL